MRMIKKIKLIIEVDEKYYEACKDAVKETYPSQIEKVIANGIPLSDKQDLAVANKLDTFVSKLTQGDDISSGRMSKEEYIEILSSLRYAISKLRGGGQ